MTYPATTSPAETEAPSTVAETSAPLESWESVRDDSDIQFSPVEIEAIPPREPGAFEQALNAFFGFLGELLSPVGALLAGIWPVLQWVLLALVVGFVLYLLINTIGPVGRRRREARKDRAAEGEPEWAPTRSESLSLLEDADRLAAEGRYDEATHLLLQRSVGQIAAARPDWVEPSSTARELAALPTLSEAARGAFGTISERVERSLFALRKLDQNDWTAARAAYTDFALVKIGGAV
ncbi:hypothetical protein [Erythrobacter sp. F6033]|uniref:hypothetical protein n=1 Tax=Erythrobacter sp. F6033 TaxID=2926401 RepID=UPI001FF1C37C|nr:hypothetical protein [Erythrobacter sp. F6033]MCK0127318.1 hypothetical protein [Erythrobacter sp. F6033]